MSYQLKQYLGAALIALSGFTVWGFIVPRYSQISSFRAAVKERRDMLQSRKEVIAKIASLNNDYQKKSADIARLSSIVPAKKSIPEIVSAIEQIASQSGIQLVGISVAEDKSASENNSNSLLIDMSLSGSYLPFLSFLEGVEKNLRIIDIISIEASRNQGLETQNTITFKVGAHSYYLK